MLAGIPKLRTSIAGEVQVLDGGGRARKKKGGEAREIKRSRKAAAAMERTHDRMSQPEKRFLKKKRGRGGRGLRVKKGSAYKDLKLRH